MVLQIGQEHLEARLLLTEKGLDRRVVVFPPAAGVNEIQHHAAGRTDQLVEALKEAGEGRHSDDAGRDLGRERHGRKDFVLQAVRQGALRAITLPLWTAHGGFRRRLWSRLRMRESRTGSRPARGAESRKSSRRRRGR